ncbi:MAG: transmembrane 220 family protein [Candidatus Neomarinimicrobiota bacterium]
MDLYKNIKIFVGLLFLCFSYLQINDPDYLYWVSVYLFSSLCTFYSIFKDNIKFVKFLSAFYFLSSIILIFKESNSDVVMYIFSENTNEIFGLIICSVWLYFLPVFNKKV